MKPIIHFFQQQLQDEAEITRKMLRLVPEDKPGWRPHPKSMNLQQLTGHIAELPSWIAIGIDTDELDFAKESYVAPELPRNQDLLDYFEKNLTRAEEALARTTEEVLVRTWTMRNGEHVLDVLTKAGVIRMTMSQLIHHRAQLGVFLRLLHIPIPGSYGPSADEMQHDVVGELA